MTQMESARKGVVTEAMKSVASEENVPVEEVVSAIAGGTAVIPFNVNHSNCRPVGVGRMFTTKINANLGRSVTHSGRGDARTAGGQSARRCDIGRTRVIAARGRYVIIRTIISQ